LLTPLPPVYALTARLDSLRAQYVADFVRHARRPNVAGTVAAHFKHWAAAYDALAALAEQNPAFAQTLLPAAEGYPLPNSLPVVPSGVLWEVDKTSPGTLTVTVDVAGALTLRVIPPTGSDFIPALVVTPTRTATTFLAVADGLYGLVLAVGSTRLATVWVAVCRAEHRLLREDARALGYGYRNATPTPSDELAERLACLIGAEAAARTGQPELSRTMLAAARAVPHAPTPTGLFPFRA
jgi:hypothetical protein